MARKINVKAKREPMPTIIGAGITEQWYFTHLKFLYDYKIKVRPRYFGTETADGMAKKIAEVLADGGTAICVFDADVSSWNEVERQKLDKLRNKYAKNKHVLLCDSMPAVEYCMRTPIASLAPQRRLCSLLNSTYLIMISRNSFSVIANGWLICQEMENSKRRVRGRGNLAQRDSLTQEYTKYLQ